MTSKYSISQAGEVHSCFINKGLKSVVCTALAWKNSVADQLSTLITIYDKDRYSADWSELEE